jgi:hypothetical protein
MILAAVNDVGFGGAPDRARMHASTLGIMPPSMRRRYG